METIWCVEDEQSIRDILLYTLKSCGFEARGFENGKSFLQALDSEHPDLVLLDIMMPEPDGMEVLSVMKKREATKDIPVIMTTAKSAEYDIISALEAGADDYLVKPYGMMEMTARIRAVLRRFKKEEAGILSFKGLSMDVQSHRVFAGGELVKLTNKEFGLLRLFMKNPDRVFSRDELFEKIWGSDFAGESRTVDVHIRTLRAKLKEEGSHIETVRGVGYRFAP